MTNVLINILVKDVSNSYIGKFRKSVPARMNRGNGNSISYLII